MTPPRGAAGQLGAHYWIAMVQNFNRNLGKFPYREKGRCSWCGGPVQKPRVWWCGDKCVEEYRVRNNPGDARKAVRARDHGVCCGCGLDTEAMRGELLKVVCEEWRAWHGDAAPYNSLFYRDPRFAQYLPRFHARCDELGIAMRQRGRVWHRGAYWQADHIKPVAEGGGGCGLDNLRTLCWRCHAEVTAALRARLKSPAVTSEADYVLEHYDRIIG